MNKKGFELSINFIVILIISLATVSIGLYISYKTFAIFGEKKAQLDSDTEAQIEAMLVGGEKVIIPIFSKTIEEGGVVFGLGVLNVLVGQTFEVRVECGPKYGVDGKVANPNPCGQSINDPDWVKMTQFSFYLKSNEDRKAAILITPADPTTGLYSFTVRVYGETGQYGYPQPIYVEVP